ncbi:hypothetical protein, partial [Streptomyces parvus]|uniref:hypothetical protein n=1 Tax=Streptomyces parvus TaxID=66428 RepID=UPI0033FA5010
MSQLRAPDARPDRREGGRHGRPGTRAHSAPSRPRAAVVEQGDGAGKITSGRRARRDVDEAAIA